MYDQDVSELKTFLGFLMHILAIISHFPLIFPFLHFLSLFSCRSRVFLFFKLSFSVLRSLVSSSCSSLFSYSSMVGYSFVRVDCPSISFLFSLFPLVSCSARVARSLKMSREVRSSELETGLSSSDNRKMLKVSSPSTSYKAWNI